jgi:hypothetical protein
VSRGTRLAVIGFNGALHGLMLVLARAVMEARAPGAWIEKTIDDDAALDELMGVDDGQSVFVMSLYPRPTLWDYLRQRAVPTVVVVDDTILCVGIYMKLTKGGMDRVTRLYSQSLAGLLHPDQRPPHILLEGDARATTMGAFLDRLAPAFDPPLAPEAIATALARLESAGDHTLGLEIRRHVISEEHEREILDGFTPQDVELVRAAVDGIADIVCGRAANVALTWSNRLFFDGATYSSPPEMTVDMTGPSRCLYFGPYIHLPTGRWRAEAVMGFSNTVRDSEIRLEVFTDRIDAAFHTLVRRGGIYALPFDFVVDSPLDSQQLRLFNVVGEIEGRVGLAMAKLWYLGPGGGG